MLTLRGAALALCLLAGGVQAQDATSAADPLAAAVPSQLVQAAPSEGRRLADFRAVVDASGDVRELAHWVVHSADNGSLPFMVIDKVQARVFAFDAAGQLQGATSALMGTAVGDESVPGIGTRKLSTIRPHERTTPSGRFVAYLDRDIHGEEVLWVDYDTALSLHRVVKGSPKERRAERLASSTPVDNRITYGCINVSVAFYEMVVSPLFQRTQGIVYILPETRPARVVFNSYAVENVADAPKPTYPAPVVLSVPVQGSL